MKNQIRSLIPMHGVQLVLAITPGLVALLMILFMPWRTSLDIPNALSAVSALLILVGLFWKRQLVSWMFPALGVFAFCLGFQWSQWVFRYVFPGADVDGSMMVLFTALFYGISLLLARRHGLVAGLILVAGLYAWADGFLDTAYGMGGIDHEILSIIPVVFMLIVAPLWMLSARTSRAQVVGLLLPGAALLGGEAYKSMVILGDPSGVRWSLLSFYFITVTLSAVIYFALHRYWGGMEQVRPKMG